MTGAIYLPYGLKWSAPTKLKCLNKFSFAVTHSYSSSRIRGGKTAGEIEGDPRGETCQKFNHTCALVKRGGNPCYVTKF